MIFGINTTRDISKLSQITYNNFEISLVVFMPNITSNHAITYTNSFMKGLNGLFLFFFLFLTHRKVEKPFEVIKLVSWLIFELVTIIFLYAVKAG